MKKKERGKMSNGIYYTLSNDDYHGSDGVSKSGLMLVENCAKKYHWRYILGNKQAEKKHFATGDGFHLATMDIKRFEKDYVCGPLINKNTLKWKEFVKDNAPKTVLGVKDYDQIMGMADAVHAHPVARNFFKSGNTEVSIYSDCPFTGEQVKVRLDWETDDIIVDLKSTTDASPSKFFRDMDTFTYFVQAGMYPLIANTRPELHYNNFVFVVVEKEPPYLVSIYRASEKDKAIGVARYRRAMCKYVECLQSGYWPAYNNDQVIDTDLNHYAVKREEYAELIDPSSSF